MLSRARSKSAERSFHKVLTAFTSEEILNHRTRTTGSGGNT